MLQNYIKIAFRNLVRNKVYSFINIVGLAMGIAAFWLIALYVGDEFSYDRFHEKANRIVRVVHHAKWDGGEVHHAVTSAAFAPALKAEFPEIQQATRIVPEGNGIITYQSKSIKVGDILFADQNVFEVFNYPFLYGNPQTALANPDAIVISESLAKTIFGDASKALNQSLLFENNYANKVTGVIKNLPENSHLQFSALRSLPTNFTGDWQNSNLYTYLLLSKPENISILEGKLPTFAKKTIQKALGVDEYRMELQPLTSIHLKSDLQYEISANGSLSRIYIFIIIALLVLVIAVINYINLSTAQSTTRVKEVGVRKIIGSNRNSIIMMFIIEALVMTTIATIIAFVLTTFFLPYFNVISGKNLPIFRFGVYFSLTILAGFSIIIGIISGIYPALLFSYFDSIQAVKGQLGSLSNSILFRKSLVVFQFTITVIMIAGSIVVYRQMEFTAAKNLGFNQNQTLTFHIDDQNVRRQLTALKSEMLKSPLILGVASAGNPIGNNDLSSQGFQFEKSDGSISSQTNMAQQLVIDADYLPTMEIKLKSGRNFSDKNEADKYNAAIVNSTLVKEQGWANPIGKKLSFKYDKDKIANRTVIGVVQDFHTFSLQHKVEPMVMLMPADAEMQDNLYLRIATKNTKEALTFLEKTYKKFDNKNPIEPHFLDQNFANQYVSERKQQKLSLIFTFLSVLIACLGLFGLAAFTAQQRIKEIGIRKVLGASIFSITTLLSKDFIKLVFISIIIASPIAYYLMNKWLEDFEYKVEISWWIFALAGVSAIVIALLTVSYQAVKAAIMNPVKSLKSE